jgi:choline dehydrogenase-like flavoprotein
LKSDADVIVIGSGPAGVSASRPLVEAGCSVLMLGQGLSLESSLYTDGSFLEIRRQKGDEFYCLKDQKKWFS